MSSPCRNDRGARARARYDGMQATGALIAARATDCGGGIRAAHALFFICILLAACQREQREYTRTPAAETAPQADVSTLHPGQAAPPAADPHGAEYEANAYHINQGARLFRWFNCNGCHGNGGGNIGPPLLDHEWRYGSGIDQIVATILQGRPNGMPAFRGKIPEQQVWQIAAYVRALSGNVPKDAAPSRSDAMSSIPPPTQLPHPPPQERKR